MISTIGEALIDFIYQESATGSVYRPVPGGSPFNTAIAMARLGVPVTFLSPISHDMFGKMLQDHLDDNGVGTPAHRTDDPTTLAFARIAEGKAEYAFYSNGSADRNVTCTDLEQALGSNKPDCFQIGSISLLLEPGATEIFRFLQRNTAESTLSFDPNIRASLVTDRAWYLQRIRELFALSDIIKISDEDLNWIFPDKDMERAASEILSLGPAVCVVTAGKEGVSWYSGKTSAYLKARDIAIVDTIGAGDTFHGGLLAYLHWSGNLDRKSLETLDSSRALTALKYASMAAEINCCRQGADPPTRDEHAAEMLSCYRIDAYAL